MFPTPQDALPLPPRPNLDQYKKRAKDLLRASQSTDQAAIRTWAASWIDLLVRLSDLTLTPQLPVRIDHWTDQLETFAHEKLSESSTLTAAQFVMARAQGFESWPKLAKHIEAVTRADSTVGNFEQAAAAIITGDLATLERTLRDHPDLIRARSTRRHQATLLHYVSANGVEGYRQKTPNNIVQIADLLLRAGADLNAVANVYGGSTTLALVATSVHPERAGVQEALMQLLLDHGAAIDAANSPAGPLINICLANGRARAAEFLATRGAHLDLEGAAGIGRLDEVKMYFDESGALRPNATNIQMERGFLRACEYGRNLVVEFLLQGGASLQSQANTGQTALHWAVIGGHADTIKLLLERGASLEAKNVYGGTALGQALWSATNGDAAIDYAPIIALLKQHGAKP
jgi:ankyrin repeat protein